MRLHECVFSLFSHVHYLTYDVKKGDVGYNKKKGSFI